MKIIIFILLFFSLNILNTNAQIGKFNAGINMRLSLLPRIESNTTENSGDVILNTPINLRYYGKSIFSFQFQIEYRKENYKWMDFFNGSNERDDNYLINSFNMLLKLNKSKDKHTFLSFGLKLFHSISEKYFYEQSPEFGDSTFIYSSSKFNHTKSNLNVSMSRESMIGSSKISLYREIFVNFPIYTLENDIPVFYSNEYGVTLGIAYNF